MSSYSAAERPCSAITVGVRGAGESMGAVFVPVGGCRRQRSVGRLSKIERWTPCPAETGFTAETPRGRARQEPEGRVCAKTERWTPCPAGKAARRARRERVRRVCRRPARMRARTPAERAPCFQRARRERVRPAGVRGPVLRPPWRRQRPLAMAGWRQSPPQRVRARQRAAARKSPERLPFFSRPRRSGGRLEGRWTSCLAVTAWRRLEARLFTRRASALMNVCMP
jgi:hypothetical protein